MSINCNDSMLSYRNKADSALHMNFLIQIYQHFFSPASLKKYFVTDMKSNRLCMFATTVITQTSLLFASLLVYIRMERLKSVHRLNQSKIDFIA